MKPERKKKSDSRTAVPAEDDLRTKDFFDCILPGTVKFMTDHYIVGDSYRCVWAIREYQPVTEEQAIFSQLADKSGVTLRMYHRLVDTTEEKRIVANAERRNKLKAGANNIQERSSKTKEATSRSSTATPQQRFTSI